MAAISLSLRDGDVNKEGFEETQGPFLLYFAKTTLPIMEEKTNRLIGEDAAKSSGGTVRIRVTSFLLFSFAKFAASFMKGIYGARIKEDIYDYFERSYCERFGA